MTFVPCELEERKMTRGVKARKIVP